MTRLDWITAIVLVFGVVVCSVLMLRLEAKTQQRALLLVSLVWGIAVLAVLLGWPPWPVGGLR